MPSKTKHLAAAKHNEKFIADHNLVSSKYQDWAVIVIFHAALHYVEAYFDKKLGYHNQNHGDRDANVNRCLRNIYADYQDLKNDARGARYDMRNFSRQEIEQYNIPQLEHIKRHVLSEMKN